MIYYIIRIKKLKNALNILLDEFKSILFLQHDDKRFSFICILTIKFINDKIRGGIHIIIWHILELNNF